MGVRGGAWALGCTTGAPGPGGAALHACMHGGRSVVKQGMCGHQSGEPARMAHPVDTVMRGSQPGGGAGGDCASGPPSSWLQQAWDRCEPCRRCEPRPMQCMRWESPVLLRLAVWCRLIRCRPIHSLHVVAFIFLGRVPAGQGQVSDRCTLVGMESSWGRPAPTLGA